HLGADDQLAAQLFGAGLAQWEAEHVGGLVVIEVALVEGVDGGVVHEGEADLRVGDALAVEDGAGHLAQGGAVQGNDLLRTGDGNAAHDDLGWDRRLPHYGRRRRISARRRVGQRAGRDL